MSTSIDDKRFAGKSHHDLVKSILNLEKIKANLERKIDTKILVKRFISDLKRTHNKWIRKRNKFQAGNPKEKSDGFDDLMTKLSEITKNKEIDWSLEPFENTEDSQPKQSTENLTSSCSSSQSNVDSMSAINLNHCTNCELKQKQLEEKQGGLNYQAGLTKDYKKQLDEANKKYEDEKNKLPLLQARCESLNNQKTDFENDISKLKSKITQIERDGIVKDSKIQNYKSKAKENTDTQLEKMAELQRLTTECNNLKGQVSLKEELNNTIFQKDEKIKQLVEENKNYAIGRAKQGEIIEKLNNYVGAFEEMGLIKHLNNITENVERGIKINDASWDKVKDENLALRSKNEELKRKISENYSSSAKSTKIETSPTDVKRKKAYK